MRPRGLMVMSMDCLKDLSSKCINELLYLIKSIVTSKARVLAIILGMIPVCFLQSQDVTSANINGLENTFYFTSDSFPVQIVRLEIDQPIHLKKISFYLDGSGTGEFEIDIFGHEGGALAPFFKEKLIPTTSLRKEIVGKQSIALELAKPILLENDYFFIQLSNFEDEMGLVCNLAYKAKCETNTWESYTAPLILEDQEGELAFKKVNPLVDLFCSNVEFVDPYFAECSIPQEPVIVGARHSISWADVNNDYWVDLLVGNNLWINKGGIFVSPITLDINSRSSVFVDFDNDSDVDILLFGHHGVTLFNNEGGQFPKAQQLLKFPLINPIAICVSDINKDKFPDILIAQLWKGYPIPLPNFLLMNNNGIALEDVSKNLYPDHDGKNNFPFNTKVEHSQDSLNIIPNENLNKRSRAAQFIDYDQDGDDDLYIANYFLEEDEFYENTGAGKFVKKLSPVDSIVSLSEENYKGYFNHGTGINWSDYDNDGDFDFIIGQLAHPRNIILYDHFGTTLFENIGNKWIKIDDNAGIQYEESQAGTAFGDIDNDGLEDIIIGAYYDCRYLDVYMQKEDHHFEMKTFESGLDKISAVHDICFVDFNNDGRKDVCFIDNGTIKLYENQIDTNNNWLKIHLRGKTTNSQGIGTRVKVYCGRDIYTKHLSSGKGQSMQSPLILHFGLSKHSVIDKIEVHWAKDNIQVLSQIAANQIIKISENDIN